VNASAVGLWGPPTVAGLIKGYGKGASLGGPIPFPVRSGAVASWEPASAADEIPTPFVAHTSEEVERKFGPGKKNTYFRIPSEGFWSTGSLRDIVGGTRVLWRGVASGPNGGQSTKVEYFSGLVAEWVDQHYVAVS
jgi:hypothetical protein